MVTRAILYRGGGFSGTTDRDSLRYGVNQIFSPVSFRTSKSGSTTFLPFCNHSFRIEDFSHFTRLSYLLNLNIMTYSDFDLILLLGLIMSITILPSCLDNSLEIPENHSSNSSILSFFAIRLTITVTGSKCLSEIL